MKIKQKELSPSSNKIKLSLEPAFQSMFISSIFISFCITFVITTTLSRLNWGTVIFALLTLLLFFLKKETYLKVNDEEFYFCYFAGLKKARIPLSEIQELVFTENRSLTVLHLKASKTYNFYLNKSNQALLSEWAQLQNIHLSEMNLSYSKKD